MKEKKNFQKKTEKLRGDERQGLLIAHYGATAEVEEETGQIIRCHLRKNAPPVTAGDRVLWQPQPNESGIIVGHLPRHSILARPERHDKIKLIAANIDLLFIVTAPPLLNEHLIDQYIVTAEKLGMKSVIVFNKTDLLTSADREEAAKRLEVYEKIGYQVIFTSLYNQEGLDALQNALQDKTSILVGPSGVGKSSMIAAFTSTQPRIGETAVSGLGKHTTTMTRLYHLTHGGYIIDSPGVREFNPANLDEDDILQGFIEFKPFLNSCEYRNCQHLKEKNCALQTAIAEGKISTIRFDSYLKMIAKK